MKGVFGMEEIKICANCEYCTPVPDTKLVGICNCKLSGCFGTDVWVVSETCDKWEKEK